MIQYILIALFLGAATGYMNNNILTVIPNAWVSEWLFDFSLVLLLFVMGFKFGMDREATSKLKKAGIRIMVIPFMTALGSIIGGLVSSYVLGINSVAAMAVCAGYGWYTLAGPLTEQLFGVEFGALGFVVNFLREALTIVTIALVTKIDKYAPVAFGGATTMDTTLPVITRYSGSDVLIAAFSSGFTLSIMAPFSITAIATLPH